MVLPSFLGLYTLTGRGQEAARKKEQIESIIDNEMEQDKLSKQELYSLIEKEFHDHNKLWGEVATAYADSSLRLFDDTIKFVYHALTAMGLVMGFGFAGIQGVQTKPLFAGGEGVMFIALMYGLYKIKSIYTSENIAIEKKSAEIKQAYEKKSIALGEMMREMRTTGKIDNKKHITDYESANSEILEIHGIGKKPQKIKDQSWFITFMIGIFILGFFLLLVSFILKF